MREFNNYKIRNIYSSYFYLCFIIWIWLNFFFIEKMTDTEIDSTAEATSVDITVVASCNVDLVR